MYANTTNLYANYADQRSFVSWRTADFDSSEGPHFVIWGLVEHGLVSQAQLDFQALFVKEVFPEGVQARDVLRPAIAPSEMPIHLVGVLAASDILIIDYF
ncbi:MAG: hypothetical protein EBQ58_12185 [Betaproteobacteria bacterium]|nr:hypothetical protein [Betaproteobacteria bacterium]